MGVYQFKIGNKYSFNNYRIYLKESPIIKPPEPKFYLVDVPFRNGSIDLSESVFDDVTYKNRKIELSCFVKSIDKNYLDLFINDFHGRKEKIFFNRDEYFLGRLSVTEVKRSELDGFIYFKINIDAEPFKISTKKKGIVLKDVKEKATFRIINNGYTTEVENLEGVKYYHLEVNGTVSDYGDKIILKHGENIIKMKTDADNLKLTFYERYI